MSCDKLIEVTYFMYVVNTRLLVNYFLAEMNNFEISFYSIIEMDMKTHTFYYSQLLLIVV